MLSNFIEYPNIFVRIQTQKLHSFYFLSTFIKFKINNFFLAVDLFKWQSMSLSVILFKVRLSLFLFHFWNYLFHCRCKLKEFQFVLSTTKKKKNRLLWVSNAKWTYGFASEQQTTDDDDDNEPLHFEWVNRVYGDTTKHMHTHTSIHVNCSLLCHRWYYVFVSV